MKKHSKRHYENTKRLDIKRKIFVIILTCQYICERKPLNEKIKFFLNSFMTVVPII